MGTKSIEANRKSDKGLKIAVVTILLILLGGIGFVSYKLGASSVYVPQAVEVHNVFVDINDDGKPDLLVSGQVILNSASSADFLASQAKH
jgi:hypothetical protein